jgi:hypothetical protein
VPSASACEQESELPPPGNRSGSGAQSVLPYLARSLQARPTIPPESHEQRHAQDKPFSNDRPGWLT